MDSLKFCIKVLFAYFALQFYSAECGQITVLPDMLLYNITTVPPADLYSLQNQRQYAVSVRILETAVADFRKQFFARFEILDLHNQLLETKVNELESYINPLDSVGGIYTHCVAKYRKKTPNIATIKVNLSNCMAKGNAAYPALAAPAEATMKNLKNYPATTESNALKTCSQKNADHESPGYLACIMTTIKASSTYLSTNTNTFYNQLNSAGCTSNLKVKEIFDCHSANYLGALNSISEARALIDNCIAGNEFCPSCSDPEVDKVVGRCPYQMSWHLNNDDLTRENIKNPFKGLNDTTPCLQINFIHNRIVVV